MSETAINPPSISADSSVADAAKNRSLWYFVWVRLKRNRTAMAGGIVFLLLVFAAVFGYFYAAELYNMQTDDVRMGPSAAHWCGTDDLGRDILHRILYGAHMTMGCAVLIVILSAAIGVPLGLAAAYLGGRFDNWTMRFMDMILAFPSILLAMAIMAALGFNLRNIVIAISLVYIPKFARIARSSALIEKSLDYIRAAESMGAGKARILFMHLLPNCVAPVLVLATLSLATAILEAAALSFLGIGAQPPLPEWGRMLNDGRSAFQTNPHIMLFPGLAIAVTVLSINLLGDGLRDAFDVRLGK